MWRTNQKLIIWHLSVEFWFCLLCRIVRRFNVGEIMQITLKRTWGKMSIWQKAKFLCSMLTASFVLPSADEFQALVICLNLFYVPHVENMITHAFD
jgi:hypothetical protein